jgi:hypothetical protein
MKTRALFLALPTILLLACSDDGSFLGIGGDADDGEATNIGGNDSADGGRLPDGAPANGNGENPGSGGEAGADADAPVPYVHFDINHVLSTGQSNATANDATTILSKTQPYNNLMFDTGVLPGTGCGRDYCAAYEKPTKLVPLVEGDKFFYPIETMSSGLANQATKLAKDVYGKASFDTLVSLHGRSGNAYICLRKGGCDWWGGQTYVYAFDDATKEIEDGYALAKAAGKSYVVRAVTAIHGEHDHYSLTGGYSYFPLAKTDGSGGMLNDYGEALEEWQHDYETTAKSITGQTQSVPLLISQYSHWNDAPHTQISFMQLAAHERSKGKVVVVGPTYALPYSSNCLHFLSDGERQLGEYFAKAYAKIAVEGRPWEPLRPTSATLAGSEITVKYHVPVPPIVIDTTLVTEAPSYGFELGGDAPPAITKVEVVGPDTVKITLASAWTSANKRLRYAYTFSGCSNGRTSARGNIRDSDKTPSQAGYDLSNWSVHFDLPL